MLDVSSAAIYTATIPAINRAWKQALGHASMVKYSRGTLIYPYEKDEKCFFYIACGRVAILHDTANGKSRHMMYMLPGSLLNVAHTLGSKLTSFKDTGCRFYFLANTELWKFPDSILKDHEFLAQHPDLIINLMESLGFKLLLMHNSLANASTGDALTKLSTFCLNMAEANGNCLELKPGISLRELSSLFGIDRSSLFRAMRKLQNMNIISILSKESLIINDLDKLRKLAID